MVRYRFFLYAGLLPYLLGAAWAYAVAGAFDAPVFWSGLAGVVLAVIGVEAFNEYFDSRMGTDRVFNPADLPPMSDAVLWLGHRGVRGRARGRRLSDACAAAGRSSRSRCSAARPRSSTRRRRSAGPTAASASWSSRCRTGRGWCWEASTCTRARCRWDALWASLVPGLLIMALAVVNAIPDFHQDRLVGKRNLVVRLGRRRAVWLYLALAGRGSCWWSPPALRPACFRWRASPRCWRCRCSWRAAAARFARTSRRARSSRRCAASSPATSSRCSLFTGGVLVTRGTGRAAA